MMSQEFLACSYSSICAGCDWLLKPAADQRAAKIAHLRSVYQSALVDPVEIEFRSCGVGATRDRVDLMIDARSGTYRLGLFDRFKTGIVDLQGCPQLSPALEKWLQEFRQIEFPISRGSVRLRVAPDGTRGVWLDFANVDVKMLLETRIVLDRLLATGTIVEIGQKRKRLVEREGRLRLDDPVLFPWFETYARGKKIPLYCSIATFTQPGFKPNHVLVEEVLHVIGHAQGPLAGSQALGRTRVAEFGSGIGNFTLPLSELFENVDAYEVDTLALEGLTKTLAEERRRNVTIHAGNFQGDKALALDFSSVDLLFVDPPRSGLMKFLEPLAKAGPRGILYVSCFAESFAADSARLVELGYKLETLTIVDQFPQSKHYETVALFTLASDSAQLTVQA